MTKTDVKRYSCDLVSFPLASFLHFVAMSRLMLLLVSVCHFANANLANLTFFSFTFKGKKNTEQVCIRWENLVLLPTGPSLPCQA